MEHGSKRTRTDAELLALIDSFDRLTLDNVYSFLLTSNLSVADVDRMVQLDTPWKVLATDAFWDTLFVDVMVAKRVNMTADTRARYYGTRQFGSWQEERERGMVNNFAHLQAYRALSRYRQGYPYLTLQKGGEHIQVAVRGTTMDVRVDGAGKAATYAANAGTVEVVPHGLHVVNAQVDMFVYKAVVDGWTVG